MINSMSTKSAGNNKRNILCKITSLVLLFVILAGTVLPATAYTASGSQAISEGDMDTLDAIFVNLSEYAGELFDSDPKSLTTSKIEDFLKEHIPFPKTVTQFMTVYDVFASSAYAFVDFGQAVAQWSKAQKEIHKEIVAWYQDVMIHGATYMEDVYSLGVSHRGRKTAMPTANLRKLQSSVISLQLSLIHNMEEMKDHPIFALSKKYRNQIQALANAAREYYKGMPSAELIYSIARYGSTDGVDHIVTILTTEKCRIISKSTGKNLNVYTDRAAKNLKNGDRINVYQATGDDTQDFRFVKNSDGSYRIRVNDCKKYLDIYNTNPNKIPKVGAKLQIWAKNTEHYRDQSFTFSKEDGYYRILLSANPKYCLYVKDNGYIALGKVKEGNDAQLWNIVYPG